MTRLVRFSNNAVSRLAANITNTDTSISLTPGDGAKFPVISGSQFFMATLLKADGTIEIVKVTARSGDTLTVVRAAEPVGSTQVAYAFTAGDRIEQRLTAKALSDELDRLDSGANIGTANKTANYTVLANDVSNLIRVDTTSGTITVTLPQISSLTDDFDIMVAKVTGDANLLNVVRAGTTDLINGVTSYGINNQWQSVWLIADRSTGTWTAINSAGSTNVTTDSFTGSGTAGPFTLSGDPGSKNNTAVFVGGVYQQKASYTLSGLSLTLGGVVDVGVPIEVVWSQPTAIGMPSDGTVTDVKVATSSKIFRRITDMVSVKDPAFGAVGDGIANDTAAIQAAVNGAAGRAIYFPAGTYATNGTITLTSNTILFADGDATISSTLPTIAQAYSGLFVSSGALFNISIQGLKFSNTVAKGFAAIYSLFAISNLKLIENECTGCALLFAFDGASDALITGNYIHNPVTEGVMDNYSRPICISRTSTNFSNVVVSNNIIKGSWTHGVNIQAGDISVQTDPTVAKTASNVVVSGNVIEAVYSATQISAGGIWFSQVQDISVTGNVVKNYGDVGIDFEACSNAVASGNTLTNNNKNLALYGNNRAITFSSNTCINTVAGLTMFWNTYSDSYPVDTRNTDIVITGNTFESAAATLSGTEYISLGTAGTISFVNNTVKNCFVRGDYFSLKEAHVNNNKFTMNYFSGAVVRGPIWITPNIKSTDPIYGTGAQIYCEICNNTLRIDNAAVGIYPIRWYIQDIAIGQISFDMFVKISGNTILGNSPTSTLSISVEDLSTSGAMAAYNLGLTVNQNRVSGSINYTKTGTRTHTTNISGNYGYLGAPYFESKSTAGALQVWADSVLTTAGSGITWTLANGQYVGQTKLIQLGTFGGGTATVTVANHDLGTSKNGTLTAANQYFLLQWHGDKWSTIKSTGTGL